MSRVPVVRHDERLLIAEGTSRLAVAADVEGLVALRAVQFGALPGEDDRWLVATRERLRAGLAAGDLAGAVVEHAGETIASGIALVTWHLPSPARPDGRIGHIHSMFTQPAARGRGHGRRILTLLLSWLWDGGVTTVELNTSVEGRALYVSAGFVEDGGDRLRLDLSERPSSR